MIVLILVRVPLTDRNERTIEKRRELITDEPNPELLVLHVNLLHRGERNTRRDLREAVEKKFGTIPAHYVVRDGFLYEEVILDEAIRQGVHRIVLSPRRYSAWHQLLREALDVDRGSPRRPARRRDSRGYRRVTTLQ